MAVSSGMLRSGEGLALLPVPTGWNTFEYEPTTCAPYVVPLADGVTTCTIIRYVFEGQGTLADGELTATRIGRVNYTQCSDGLTGGYNYELTEMLTRTGEEPSAVLSARDPELLMPVRH